MTDERIHLTPAQAKAMLDPDAKLIHTYRAVASCMLGADWGRSQILTAIDTAVEIELGGEHCRRMNHGLVVWTDSRSPLFVCCRAGFDYEALEAELTDPPESTR
jgi:hypothetical protein